jgi:hypothetical protein
MIVLESLPTGAAQPPPTKLKPTVGMSSPGGEETGEGELNSKIRNSKMGVVTN